MRTTRSRSILALIALVALAAGGCGKSTRKPVIVSPDGAAARRQAIEDSLRALQERAKKVAVTPEAPKSPAAPAPAALSFQDVHFDFDSARLTGSDLQLLSETASGLARRNDVRVVIEGHCDERGTSEYNLALGERRAASVQQYLTRYGINTDRLETVSYGEERPLDADHNETAWAKNRRAHLFPK